MIDPLNGLREKLSYLGAISAGLVGAVPKGSMLETAKDLLATQFAFPTLPDQARREELYRLFQGWLSDRTKQLTEEEWSQAPFVVLMGNPCLGNDENFFSEISERVRTEEQPRMLRRSIYAYLRDFNPDVSCLNQFASLIETQLNRHSGPALSVWKIRASEPQSLFKASDLPLRLARTICIDGVPYRDALRDLGFTSDLIAHSGLNEPIARALILTLSDAFRSRTKIEHAALIDALSFLEIDGKLRFVGMRTDIPDILLTPFQNMFQIDSPVQNAIADFFGRVYGSPRTSKNSWIGVCPEAIGVMERWLVRKSLDLFFEILNKSADGIWRYRRSFWLAFYRAGLIQDAWPVFGKDALALIKRDPAFSRRLPGCAKLAGGQSNQSVLLMKLPGLIVAEWSHAGACRVWLLSDMSTPRMFNFHYTAGELRSECSYAQSHHGTHGGTWQFELSQWIETHTHVHIPMSKLMANTNA